MAKVNKTVKDETIETAETKETVLTEVETVTETKFSKNAFLKSESYKKHKDLLATILKDNESYSKSEVNKMVEDYLKGKVK